MLMILTLVAVSGCTRLQPAGGKVLVDGKPVQEGTIMFYPVNKGRPANARIQPDGSFTLSYENPGDGLPPGEYKVVIVADIWQELKKTKAQEQEEAIMKKNGVNDELPTNGILIHVVPPEYNDVKTTPLTQKVESSSSTQNFVFEISTKGKKS